MVLLVREVLRDPLVLMVLRERGGQQERTVLLALLGRLGRKDPKAIKVIRGILGLRGHQVQVVGAALLLMVLSLRRNLLMMLSLTTNLIVALLTQPTLERTLLLLRK